MSKAVSTWRWGGQLDEIKEPRWLLIRVSADTDCVKEASDVKNAEGRTRF